MKGPAIQLITELKNYVKNKVKKLQDQIQKLGKQKTFGNILINMETEFVIYMLTMSYLNREE